MFFICNCNYRYLPKYVESKFHVKCQVDLFTNGDNVSLYDILLNQTAMFYFMEVYIDLFLFIKSLIVKERGCV
jgi:hypothetical protein